MDGEGDDALLPPAEEEEVEGPICLEYEEPQVNEEGNLIPFYGWPREFFYDDNGQQYLREIGYQGEWTMDRDAWKLCEACKGFWLVLTHP